VSSVLLLLWGTGAALSGLLCVRDALTVRRLVLSGSLTTDPSLRQQVAVWSARLGLAEPPRLAQSEAVVVPTLADRRTPMLLLPSSELRGSADFGPVIVHELAHILRGDLLVQALARLVRAIWWWHPLAWLTVRELAGSAEEACDD
jgi:beta-lactamase regulating signal transducer with metallopeptidase domain